MYTLFKYDHFNYEDSKICARAACTVPQIISNSLTLYSYNTEFSHDAVVCLFKVWRKKKDKHTCTIGS